VFLGGSAGHLCGIGTAAEAVGVVVGEPNRGLVTGLAVAGEALAVAAVVGVEESVRGLVNGEAVVVGAALGGGEAVRGLETGVAAAGGTAAGGGEAARGLTIGAAVAEEAAVAEGKAVRELVSGVAVVKVEAVAGAAGLRGLMTSPAVAGEALPSAAEVPWEVLDVEWSGGETLRRGGRVRAGEMPRTA
jgi:hypothetical protein